MVFGEQIKHASLQIRTLHGPRYMKPRLSLLVDNPKIMDPVLVNTRQHVIAMALINPIIVTGRVTVDGLQLTVDHQEASFSGNHDTLVRSEEHTSELQSRQYLVCRLLLEKKKHTSSRIHMYH